MSMRNKASSFWRPARRGCPRVATDSRRVPPAVSASVEILKKFYGDADALTIHTTTPGRMPELLRT